MSKVTGWKTDFSSEAHFNKPSKYPQIFLLKGHVLRRSPFCPPALKLALQGWAESPQLGKHQPHCSCSPQTNLAQLFCNGQNLSSATEHSKYHVFQCSLDLHCAQRAFRKSFLQHAPSVRSWHLPF